MTTADLKQAIDRLGRRQRTRLVLSVLRQEIEHEGRLASVAARRVLEDYFDVKHHRQALKRGNFESWTSVQKRLDARRHTRKKRS